MRFSRRYIDEKIRNTNCGMRPPPWKNWLKAKDEIEMEVKKILMSGLVTDLIFYLVALKQTQPRSNREEGK